VKLGLIGTAAGFFSGLFGIGGGVVMVPLLSSVSYELLRLGARNANVPLTRLLARPGLLLQRLTTREPDDAQVEVAIAAMKAALSLDGETA